MYGDGTPASPADIWPGLPLWPHLWYLCPQHTRFISLLPHLLIYFPLGVHLPQGFSAYSASVFSSLFRKLPYLLPTFFSVMLPWQSSSNYNTPFSFPALLFNNIKYILLIFCFLFVSPQNNKVHMHKPFFVLTLLSLEIQLEPNNKSVLKQYLLNQYIFIHVNFK